MQCNENNGCLDNGCLDNGCLDNGCLDNGCLDNGCLDNGCLDNGCFRQWLFRQWLFSDAIKEEICFALETQNCSIYKQSLRENIENCKLPTSKAPLESQAQGTS